jgi:hypothetical protein
VLRERGRLEKAGAYDRPEVDADADTTTDTDTGRGTGAADDD